MVIGETICKPKTLDPTWADESFSFNLSHGAGMVTGLVIEVWDKDFFTQVLNSIRTHC